MKSITVGENPSFYCDSESPHPHNEFDETVVFEQMEVRKGDHLRGMAMGRNSHKRRNGPTVIDCATWRCKSLVLCWCSFVRSIVYLLVILLLYFGLKSYYNLMGSVVNHQ